MCVHRLKSFTVRYGAVVPFFSLGITLFLLVMYIQYLARSGLSDPYLSYLNFFYPKLPLYISLSSLSIFFSFSFSFQLGCLISFYSCGLSTFICTLLLVINYLYMTKKYNVKLSFLRRKQLTQPCSIKKTGGKERCPN